MDTARERSGSVSKRKPMQPPTTPGRARRDSPMGTERRGRRETREKDMKELERSMRAWLSHGGNPAKGQMSKKGKEGGLGEKEATGPQSKAPGEYQRQAPGTAD